MSRLGRERALFIGLAALQDYVDQARDAPLPASLQLRALLALLALHGGGETDAYRLFWATVRKQLDPAEPYHHQQDYIRGTGAQTQWTGIARDIGFPALSNEFCHKVQMIARRARGEPVEERQGKHKRDCGWL